MPEQTIDSLRQCQGFLLDMDGTLYLDETLLPGALEFVHYLQRCAIPHLYLTNNSSRSGHAYVDRLGRLGIETTRDRILTSGDATILHLLQHTPHRSVYLIGTKELEQDFVEAGIAIDVPEPDCVVVGYDTGFHFDKLETACHLLFAGKPYFATHPDRTCITQRGLIPDIAAIIAAIEAVTRRSPKIIGKPYNEIVDAALQRLGTTARHTAMIGDQLDTDMTMAQQSQLCGVLVRTGETTAEKLSTWPDDQKAFLIADGVNEILSWLSSTT